MSAPFFGELWPEMGLKFKNKVFVVGFLFQYATFLMFVFYRTVQERDLFSSRGFL